MDKLETAKEKFAVLLTGQLARVERMKNEKGFLDYRALEQIIIGVAGGDGIGPAIIAQAKKIIETLLKTEIAKGRVLIKDIHGLTIENRTAVKKAIPDDVLAELKTCHVILKGPTTTPEAGSPWPNLESANVAMRKELDLFANVRPVRVPEQGIDWTFFRENTEGAYAVGSMGFEVDEDLAVDFTITTTQGTERIVRRAFDYAEANGKTRVTAVTKANIIKTTDGKFLRVCREIAKDYPGVTLDEWYIDIMTAKLVDEKRRAQFQVFVLPNLYGDILTDEAAEFQGGVGTAGSANIGERYAMFEAIHGSAPRMVKEGRSKYADPSSIIRAAAMMLSHIGYAREASDLTRAMDECAAEKRIEITGRENGAASEEWAEYIISKLCK
ncbi:MAG: isocitrate/isopropylmalate dehydrogenase family protein [Clostridiales bacterium]|jgi:isocitrate dehydrogenase (NAD+)|nr:isocitrate/isopropylmalate dehydrogenase family protein [Clostridiales bacterium]